jgi:hypothetical protein
MQLEKFAVHRKTSEQNKANHVDFKVRLEEYCTEHGLDAPVVETTTFPGYHPKYITSVTVKGRSFKSKQGFHGTEKQALSMACEAIIGMDALKPDSPGTKRRKLNKFANDGSFMEKFMQMQQEQEEGKEEKKQEEKDGAKDEAAAAAAPAAPTADEATTEKAAPAGGEDKATKMLKKAAVTVMAAVRLGEAAKLAAAVPESEATAVEPEAAAAAAVEKGPDDSAAAEDDAAAAVVAALKKDAKAYDKSKVADLKQVLETLGLETKGKKAQLVARIKAHAQSL